jgi:aspartokinase/homoserine dehydrogenase 1
MSIIDVQVPMSFQVHKFGGTSVGSVEAFRQVKDIIAGVNSNPQVAIVVSAIGGKPKVTDMLIDSVTLAAAGNVTGYKAMLASIRAKHTGVINDLIPEADRAAIESAIQADVEDIADLCRAAQLLKHADANLVEIVSGCGEKWSARILAAYLRSQGMDYKFLDARQVRARANRPATFH